MNDFLARAIDFDFATPVYLDSHLGDNIQGETFASDIRARGFSEIYLVTGYSPDRFGAVSDIKAVLDKRPPWQA